MVNNLRRGILLEAISNLCPLCGRVRETVDNFFPHCEFFYTMWCHFLAKCIMSCYFPRSLPCLFEAWCFTSFSGSSAAFWRLIPFATL